jgi:anti-sigma regulatory factor (Ser/Thr protein kinase)
MPVTLVTLTSTSDLDSVPEVRRFATHVVEEFDARIDPYTVALLTTELVANAVRVAAGEVTTSFVRAGNMIRIVVHDNGGGQPVLAHPDPLDDDGGRGLMLVDTLADAWGAEAHAHSGTTVWFELAAPTDPTRGSLPHDDDHASGRRSASKATLKSDGSSSTCRGTQAPRHIPASSRHGHQAA